MATDKRKPRSRKTANGAADNDAGEGPGNGHNSKVERAEIIVAVCTQLDGFDKRIAALQADRRAVVSKRIKGDLGMKVGDFNAAYRLSKLDPEARAEMTDTIRETFLALGVGEQGTLFPTDEDAAPRASAPAKSRRKAKDQPTA